MNDELRCQWCGGTLERVTVGWVNLAGDRFCSYAPPERIERTHSPVADEHTGM